MPPAHTFSGSGCVKPRIVLRNASGKSAAASSQLLFPPTPLGPSNEGELGPAKTGSPAHISAKTQLAQALSMGPVKAYKVIPYQARELTLSQAMPSIDTADKCGGFVG